MHGGGDNVVARLTEVDVIVGVYRPRADWLCPESGKRGWQ